MMNYKELKFLVYISKIIYTNYDPYIFTLYMYSIHNRIRKLQNSFKIKVADYDFIQKLLKQNQIIDINNTIVTNSLPGYIKFVWIVINEKNVQIRRKVHVITADSVDKNQIYVNKTLFYNLKEIDNCFLKRANSYWRTADEVEICLINSPLDLGNNVYDLILKNYFTTPKILYRDDIIEIKLKDYCKSVFYSKNIITDINQSIYFKCNKVIKNNKICLDGGVCIINESTLKQTANIQSFIPKDCQITNPPICPYGLDGYFQDLLKASRPFLTKKKINFKPTFLLEGNKGSGKKLLVKSLASYFGMHLYTVYNFDIAANVYAQNETKIRNILFTAKMTAPCVVEIRNFENFGKNQEGQYDERIIGYFVEELETFFNECNFPVILCCCSNEKDLPIELKRIFLKIFTIKSLNEQEREDNLKWILKMGQHKIDINLKELANKTHGFLFEDLKALVYHALTNYNRQQHNNKSKKKLENYENHFNRALDFLQANYNQSVGAPKIPKVYWSDIGGLNDVRDEIIKLIKWPLEHPELLAKTGLKRSGILLYGPPGTGKTLTAKAVATECGLCFLSVKGPELLNMYVGQSEQNIREVFERARDASPCIIFFDELDSLAPNRGASGDSGGVMDRVVSQLLAEMDGLNQSQTVFIIGATNRPDLIDPALLRPGRFDKLLYVGPCIDRDSKISVFQALTRKFKFEENLEVSDVVDSCPGNFSGADFYGVCSAAWMSAIRRLIYNIENNKITGKNFANLTGNDVKVNMDDFKAAIKNVKPSITKEDLEYFRKLKAEFS